MPSFSIDYILVCVYATILLWNSTLCFVKKC